MRLNSHASLQRNDRASCSRARAPARSRGSRIGSNRLARRAKRRRHTSRRDADGATTRDPLGVPPWDFRAASPPLARFAPRVEPGVPRGVSACDFEGVLEGVLARAEGDFEGAFASAARGNLAGVAVLLFPGVEPRGVFP